MLDALFGAEEEFEYSSTTTASSGGGHDLRAAVTDATDGDRRSSGRRTLLPGTQLSGSSGMSHHRIASTQAPIASAVAMPGETRCVRVVCAAFS